MCIEGGDSPESEDEMEDKLNKTATKEEAPNVAATKGKRPAGQANLYEHIQDIRAQNKKKEPRRKITISRSGSTTPKRITPNMMK